MTQSTADLIDLTEAADACRPLVAWWRRWEATGTDDPAGLDSALRRLGTCPALRGPLGRAVATFDRSILASQPRPVLVAAMAQLVRLADIQSRPSQLMLPGLDLPAPADATEPDEVNLERAPRPEPA